MQISNFSSLSRTAAAVAAAATVAFCVSGSAAQAQTNVNPGQFAAVPVQVFGLPTGTQIDIISDTFFASNAGQTITGSYVSAVYDRGGGLLDFYYQFTTEAGSTAPITEFAATSFAGFSTSVGYFDGDLDGAGPFIDGSESPVNASRSGNGVTVTFDYFEVNVGETSEVLLIRTNATSYVQGNSSVQGGASANFTTLAPTRIPDNTIPEPGTLALAGIGILGIAVRASRRGRR